MSRSWNLPKLFIVLIMVTIAVCCGRGRNGSSDVTLTAFNNAGELRREGSRQRTARLAIPRR